MDSPTLVRLVAVLLKQLHSPLPFILEVSLRLIAAAARLDEETLNFVARTQMFCILASVSVCSSLHSCREM